MLSWLLNYPPSKVPFWLTINKRGKFRLPLRSNRMHRSVHLLHLPSNLNVVRMKHLHASLSRLPPWVGSTKASNGNRGNAIRIDPSARSDPLFRGHRSATSLSITSIHPSNQCMEMTIFACIRGFFIYKLRSVCMYVDEGGNGTMTRSRESFRPTVARWRRAPLAVPRPRAQRRSSRRGMCPCSAPS